MLSALIAAPIAALVFGGVTGSGTDLLVAAFQQAGSDLQTAVLQQSLISDPIDKTITFLVVFVAPGRDVAPGRGPVPAGRARTRHGPGLIIQVERAGAGSTTAEGLAPADAALLARLAPTRRPAYHRLNPLTKATLAAVARSRRSSLGGYLGPLLLLALLVLPGAVAANVLGSAIRRSLVAAAPIAISVALVSLFTRAGTTVLFQLGPFDATLEGLDFAPQLVLRLFVLAMALAVFGLTTEPRALVADLERRGSRPGSRSPRPRRSRRCRRWSSAPATIGAAQRARGLDTEGSVGARLRGLVPLGGAGPAVVAQRGRGAQPRARGARLRAARPARAPLDPDRHHRAAGPALGPPRRAGAARRRAGCRGRSGAAVRPSP